MGEEYSISTNFKNHTDFELTEYGLVKKRFVDFIARRPDIGEPFTPMAVVLPADLPMLDIEAANTYLGVDLDGDKIDKSLSDTEKKVKSGLAKIFGSSDGMCGNECHVIKNGGLPDAIDIIHSDTHGIIEKYDYLIDLTGDSGFADRHSNTVTVDDAEAVMRKIMPVWVDGAVQWCVNRTKNGWLVYIANNSGIERSPNKGERAIENSSAHARLTGTDRHQLRRRGQYDEPARA